MDLGGPPQEYIELVLCRDVYHCTPLELKSIPLKTVLRHLTCVRVESNTQRTKGSVKFGKHR